MERNAYDSRRVLPFPEGSAVNHGDAAPAVLAYGEAMTAEAVVPVVEHWRRYDPGVLDFRVGLAALLERLAVLRGRASGSEAANVDKYVGYGDALAAGNWWAANHSH